MHLRIDTEGLYKYRSQFTARRTGSISNDGGVSYQILPNLLKTYSLKELPRTRVPKNTELPEVNKGVLILAYRLADLVGLVDKQARAVQDDNEMPLTRTRLTSPIFEVVPPLKLAFLLLLRNKISDRSDTSHFCKSIRGYITQ